MSAFMPSALWSTGALFVAMRSVVIAALFTQPSLEGPTDKDSVSTVYHRISNGIAISWKITKKTFPIFFLAGDQ